MIGENADIADGVKAFRQRGDGGEVVGAIVSAWNDGTAEGNACAGRIQPFKIRDDWPGIHAGEKTMALRIALFEIEEEKGDEGVNAVEGFFGDVAARFDRCMPTASPAGFQKGEGELRLGEGFSAREGDTPFGMAIIEIIPFKFRKSSRHGHFSAG